MEIPNAIKNSEDEIAIFNPILMKVYTGYEPAPNVIINFRKAQLCYAV